MSARAGFVIVVLVVLTMGVALCGPSAAQPVLQRVSEEAAVRTWTAGVDATVYSEYVWRGLNKYETSIAPSVYVRFPSFCIKVAGIAETGGGGGMGEVTPSLEYFFSAGELDFSVGYIFYGYDESLYSDTSEIFGKASWNTGTPISPSLEMYWDIDEADALYARLGVCYADRIEDISYKLLATLGGGTEGFSETYFWVSESGLTDFEISFSMVIPVSEQISFEPFVGYSVLVNSSIKTFAEDDSNEYIGASIHVVF